MPKVYMIETKDIALTTAFKKLYDVEDLMTLVINSHLIIEAVLYKYIVSKFASKKYLKNLRLTYNQIYNIAMSFRKDSSKEKWFWDIIGELNKIRNRIVHNLDNIDIEGNIDKLFELSKNRIDIYAPGTNKNEREEKKYQLYFIVLIGIAYNLIDDKSIE